MSLKSQEDIVLYGRKTHNYPEPKSCEDSIYSVTIHPISDNSKFAVFDVIKDVAFPTFQTMIENTEKLKLLKKFIANNFAEVKQMLFCDIFWATKYHKIKSKSRNEAIQKLYYGHHVLLLIPVKSCGKIDNEKVKTNIANSIKMLKNGGKNTFTLNLLNEFLFHDKMQLSEVPCKMLVDFQQIFINTLEDLHKDTEVALSKNAVPVYIKNPWNDDKELMAPEIAASAIKLAIMASEVMDILYNLVEEIEQKAFENYTESNYENIFEKLLKFCNDDDISAEAFPELYGILSKFYTKFWNENDKKYFCEITENELLLHVIQKLQNLMEQLVVRNEGWYDTILFEAKNDEKNEKSFDETFESEDSQKVHGVENMDSLKCKDGTDEMMKLNDKRHAKRGKNKNHKKASEVSTSVKSDAQNSSEAQETEDMKQNFLNDEEDDYEKIEKPTNVSLSTLSPSKCELPDKIQHFEISPKMSLVNRISAAEFSQIISIKPVPTKTEFQTMSSTEPPNTKVTPLPKRKPNYNIILIGESGSGKSTFVNAFQNYLKFSTLEEALNSESIECSIPVRFNIHTDTTSFENILIEYGTKTDDKNECFDDISASCTQQPKKYAVEFDDYNLTIIDTPGSSDTRGSTQDYENLNLIKSAISKVDKIDAICLTILSNQTKLSTGFETRMKNLLSLFPSNPNIFFFFTNVGANHYYIGDAMTVIRELIKSYNSSYFSNIQINSSSVYSIENEGFRFLIAKKVGKKYTAQSEENCIKSWEHSAKEVQRFLATIKDQGKEGANNFDVSSSEIINNRF